MPWRISGGGRRKCGLLQKDELIATITTDETGIAKLSDLPLGKYYVKEKETAEGYVLDGETGD